MQATARATFTPQQDGAPSTGKPPDVNKAAANGLGADSSDARDAFSSARVDASAATGNVQQGAAPQKSAAQAFSGVTWQTGSNPPAGSISGGGLIAGYCCAGASSTVLANRGVSSGLHYLELTLSARPGEQRADTWTTAGVVATDGVSRHAHMQLASSDQVLDLQVGRGRGQFRSGDVITLAIDATQRQVYWGHNGQWMNGTPGKQDGHPLKLQPGQQLFPFVAISASSRNTAPEGDRWIANFGASPFRYPIPAGFNSYGSNAGNTVMPGTPLPAPATAPAVTLPKDALMGKTFRDVIRIKREAIPLPAGEWSTLAHFRAEPGSSKGDAVILGQMKDRQLVGLIALNAYSHEDGVGRGFPAFKGCSRNELLAQHTERNEADGIQHCWWINHAVSIWTEQSVFRAAMTELAQRGVTAPPVLLNVGFRRANLQGFATVHYYFNPETAQITSAAGSWHESEWHRSRIAADGARLQYVKGMEQWGESWAPIFFAAK
jgi:hypothetical protein